MTANALTRSQARANIPDPIRIQLLEGDMDEADVKVDTILAGQQKLMWWAMGLIASLMTTSVLLFVNLVR